MTLTLNDVAEYLDGWKPYDGYGMALCIEHDERHASMQVSQKGYFCKSCGAKGSLEKLYEKVSGRVVIKQRVYNSSGGVWRKWEKEFGSIQAIAKLAHKLLKEFPNDANFLTQRKIDSQIKTGMFGYLEGYYTFPIRDEFGEVHGIVARASPTIQSKDNRYTVSPKCPVKLYVPNWRKVLKDDNLYVCYGTIDAWSLHMAGYASITGLSGQEFNSLNLDRFRKPIYIIPDRGEERAAIDLQCKLDWRGKPLFLQYPEGCKDVNDVHKNFGIDKIIELVEKQKEKYNYERNQVIGERKPTL